VEALFAELTNQIGLRRLRLRRMKFVREQFFLAAAAQNIKRLVRPHTSEVVRFFAFRVTSLLWKQWPRLTSLC